MPQTERLFQEDSFCRRFTAQVVACEPYKSGWRAELSRTAFFPEGGGQPCDLGTLQPQNGPEVQVLDVQESEGRVLHTLDAPLPVGESVTGEINWQRRRDAMEQHSGEHILSGLLHTLFGADNVGFHIGPDQVRMDMSVELSAAQLACAEEKANAIVRENVPVLVSVPSPEELSALTYRSKKELEGPVRIVKIPGADVCACCGTHVERTGQVGLVKILTHQNYKGGTRLMIACGQRAFAALAAEHDALTAASQLLSAKLPEVPSAVERLLTENQALKAARAEAENRWFAAVAESAPAEKPFCTAAEGLSGDSLRRLALAIAEKTHAAAAALCPRPEGGFAYALAPAPGGDARALAKALNLAFEGRGGGKPALCQGSIARGDLQEVKQFLETTEI